MNVALVLPIISPPEGGGGSREVRNGGKYWAGGGGGGGVFAGQPIFLIQSKIQISFYI